MSEKDTDSKKKDGDDPFADAMQAAAEAVDRVHGVEPEGTPVGAEAEGTPAPDEAADAAPAATSAELEAARKSAADWKDRAMREAANLANFRKRANKEKDDLRKFAVESLLKDLLGVVDNIERAVSHASEDDPLASGVRMVNTQFLGVLEQHGAKPFDAMNLQFDPSIHEAMTQVERDDVEPGTVIEVFQRGWYLNERLARPAMVVVAAPPAEASQAAAQDTQPVAVVSDEDVAAHVEKETPDADEQD